MKVWEEDTRPVSTGGRDSMVSLFANQLEHTHCWQQQTGITRTGILTLLF